MNSRSLWFVAVTLAALVGFLAVSASHGVARQDDAKPVTGLLPESTFLYVNWDGIDAHRAPWEKTAAHESVVKSGLAGGIFKVIESLVPAKANAQFEQVMAVIEKVMLRGFSLSVAFSGEAPIPYGTAVFHKSADFEPLLAELVKSGASEKVEERTLDGRKVSVIPNPNMPGVEFAWWNEGEHLVVVIGMNAVQGAIDVAEGKAKNITANSLWSARKSNPAGFEQLSDAWLHLSPLRERFGGIEVPISSDPQNPKSTTIGKILELLGLDTLKSISMRSGIKERAMWSEVLFDAPAPRKGLLALADQKSISLADMPPIPANCPGFLLNSFDIGNAFDTVLKTVKDIASLQDPATSEQIDGGLAQLDQMLGFGLKADLLDPLGHIQCVYSDSGQGPFGFGFGAAVSVDDAEKLRATINKLLNHLEQQLGPQQLDILRAQKHGREVATLQIGGGVVNPALCVDNKWFVLGLSTQSIDTFLMRLDKKLPAWSPSDEHKEAMAATPQKFTSLSVSDPRVSVQGALTMATTMGPAMIAGFRQEMRRQQGPDVEPEGAPQGNPLAELPPAELVVAPLFPNVSWCTVDDNGVLIRERTSLPSMLGVAGAPAVGVGVALLLPAVQQAREAARRTQSQNNLKQIALAMHNYHDTYRHFPQGARPNVDLSQDKLLSWQVEILPYIDQGNLYDTIDRAKPWDDPVNKTALSTSIPVYMHPSVPLTTAKDGYAVTNYVGIAGIGKDGPTLPVDNPKAGVFAYNRPTRIGDIRDGTSNTMMVIETKTNVGPWGAAGVSTIRPLTQKPYLNGPDGFGGISAGGGYIALADGSVLFISNDIDPKVFEALSTINGGENVPQE